MKDRRQRLGAGGEEIALAYLKKNRYTIVATNYRCRYGEIDIIARDRNRTLCFIEVKTRTSGSHGLPQEAVTPRKQGQISRAALEFIQRHRLENTPARFDVVAVSLRDSGHTVELIQNAFELNLF
jgi:putative endonuclease